MPQPQEIHCFKWEFCDLIIKPTICINFTNLFLEYFSVNHQESSIVHTAIQTGYADCLLAGSGRSVPIPLASSQHNLYDIYLLLCLQYQTPDDGQRNCPKHVEVYSKNKFEKLVHLIGFIVSIYHDAGSSECQIGNFVFNLCEVFKEHNPGAKCNLPVLNSAQSKHV